MLYGWMFRAARAATGATVEEVAASAGIGRGSIVKIEAADLMDIRAEAHRRVDGGFSPDVVDKLRGELLRRGYEIREASGGWPAAIVKVGG
jgi:hypothetical protein